MCSAWSDACYYSNITGTLSVSCERWHGAQSVEQITWDRREIATDRNEAHAKSFDYYKSLPQNLGHMIEIGAGPFTQSQTILQDKTTATSITLIEPMAFHYITHVKKCFYKNGTFKNLPTTLLSIPAEELNNTRKFDSLVMINVIEHVYDALSILNSAINLIKENGLFIWHERLWDNYRGVATPPGNDREFQLHPIRIKTVIAKHIMSMFEEVYVSWDTEELRRLKNQGVYFIGRRRNMATKTNIPQHPPCFEQNKGKQTVIVFVSNANSSLITNLLETVNAAANTKTIIIIQTNSLSFKATADILKFSKIKIMLSYQHLQNWREEVSYYAEPCLFIYPHLTSSMLEGSGTLCVGTSGVSIVLMGYSTRRFPNYETILPSYSNMGIIDQIILIWNNNNESFTPNIDSPKIKLIKPAVNSMNNRFNVSEYLRTDAVMVIDDDVLISESLLSLMLLRWSENTNRLVGISRDMRYVNSNNEYLVSGKNPSLTIGKTMLFHRTYLKKYMQDKTLVEWNRKRFCEDISMNALIFKETNLKPLFVPMTGQNARKDLTEIDGASVVDKNWALRRTECVQWVSEYFHIKLY
ncbi:EXT2 [Mytilus coruscus]|uniref:EXT2 n=1 Tax=Mytilus coruscus TaxID=42192 RepID=A0A6J8EHR9_MYTCO|nr:EXT2 [Mytilus coruscus]